MKAIRSATRTLTLNEVLSRLARSADVDGVARLGSSARDRLGPASDYDLLVVLASSGPIPDLALTEIDRRLADVIFVSRRAIEVAAGGSAVEGPWSRDRILAWLRDAHIELDRSGRLRELQDVARRVAERPDAVDLERLWFKLNYDVKQTMRLLESDDPIYLTTVDLRLLFGLDQALVGYFALRRLPWRGQKEALKFISDHDPQFLETLRSCLDERDRSQKVSLYEQLVGMALAPLGAPWPDGFTSVQAAEGESVDDGLRLWTRLVAE